MFSPTLCATSFFAKRSSGRKVFVNILTSLNSADEARIVQSRAVGDVEVPACVTAYRKLHVFVDARHSRIRRYANLHRQRNSFRVKLAAIEYEMLQNACLVYRL